MNISTHILDTSRGRPAAGVAIMLARLEQSEWTPVSESRTDDDGRVLCLLPEGHSVQEKPGIYRLRFETASYFAAHKQESLYPYVDIIFQVQGAAHYHVPLLLAANGYTTYRGS